LPPAVQQGVAKADESAFLRATGTNPGDLAKLGIAGALGLVLSVYWIVTEGVKTTLVLMAIVGVLTLALALKTFFDRARRLRYFLHPAGIARIGHDTSGFIAREQIDEYMVGQISDAGTIELLLTSGEWVTLNVEEDGADRIGEWLRNSDETPS
jgi:hypothetical protein